MSDKKWKHVRNLSIILFFSFCIGFTVGMEIIKEQEATMEKRPPSGYELLERTRTEEGTR